MEFLIISGLSGAGKSSAMNILEDMNYYCVDNMPVVLIPKFAELCLAMSGSYNQVALITDIRERYNNEDLFKALDELQDLGCEYKILFVEADVGSIVKRYKETRRRHPLASEGGSIEDAVSREIEKLEPMRSRADYVIDTSRLTLSMLQSELYSILGSTQLRTLNVNIISFGFKYGIPIEADIVFDVRFLPNPYYVLDLRDLTGMDSAVYDYVFSYSDTGQFMRILKELFSFLLPQYVEEGKYSLTVAIGCTGGRHRSVAVARALSAFIEELGHKQKLINRDVGK